MNSNTNITGTLTANVYDAEQLQERYSDWDTKTRTEKFDATRSITPVQSETVTNKTTNRFHQYLCDNLNYNKTADKDNLSITWVAVGNSGASGVSASDKSLNSRVFTTDEVNFSEGTTGELITETFLGTQDAEGKSIDEIGLFTGNPNNTSMDDVFMINHATFTTIEKDDGNTATLELTLSFSN